MGMYDYVRCKVKLPDAPDMVVFQTKDFECPYLETYVIEDDGRLYKEPTRYDDGSGNDRTDLKFHGVLNFYGLDEARGWHEYNAKFTDGQLVEIKQVPNS